jgi:hypothetical protein
MHTRMYKMSSMQQYIHSVSVYVHADHTNTHTEHARTQIIHKIELTLCETQIKTLIKSGKIETRVEDVTKLIRGKAFSRVNMTVVRANEEPREVSVRAWPMMFRRVDHMRGANLELRLVCWVMRVSRTHRHVLHDPHA